MNLQEKLESANRLYEDLKKGKEELDARKEIYERLAFAHVRTSHSSCVLISAKRTLVQCAIHGVGSTNGSSIHTHCSSMLVMPFHAFFLGGTMHTQREVMVPVQDPVDICS